MSNHKFFMQLRGTDSSPYYIDMSGNSSWSLQGSLSRASGKFVDPAIHFSSHVRMNFSMWKETIYQDEPFTIAFWFKFSPGDGGKYNYIYGTSTRNGRWLNDVYDLTWAMVDGVSTLSLQGQNYNQFPDGSASVDICNFDSFDTWIHYAITNDGSKVRAFLDGRKVTESDSSTHHEPLWEPPSSTKGIGFIHVRTEDGLAGVADSTDIDDFCVLNTCLWTRDFIPPSGYLELPKKIFLSGNAAYGINTSGSFTKLTDNFAVLTDEEKLTIMNNVQAETQPTIAQLETLAMPIKVVDSRVWGENLDCTITAAITAGQTITPKGRISLSKYTKLKSVNITGATSGNGVLKVAITKDNTNYQVWDAINSVWKTINLADIATGGMSISEVAAIDVAGWTAFDCLDSGVGFAYYLELSSASDEAYTDELSLSVELVGELQSLVQGRDYDYGYVANNVLQVKLYKDGNFRINYYSGQPSSNIKVPSVNSNLTFNGAKQAPTFNNYDPDKMKISGELDGTDAGTRTVSFTPINGYQWEDSTTAAKNVTWAIEKANSNLTVDNTSVSLGVGESTTVTASYDGDGILSAVPSANNVVVVVDGKDIVITGETVGNDSVEVIVTDSMNYNGGVETVMVTVS